MITMENTRELIDFEYYGKSYRMAPEEIEAAYRYQEMQYRKVDALRMLTSYAFGIEDLDAVSDEDRAEYEETGMETESKRWKLGDDVSAEDNILDGFTFKDLILAVHCNCESITPEAVRREAAEILEERMQDYRFLLRNNIEEIMAEAKKGRAQYE